MADVVAIRGRTQWLRCGFAAPAAPDLRAALEGDVVSLARRRDPAAPGPGEAAFTGGFAGLAFDAACRLFHPVPEEGRIEFLLSGIRTALNVSADTPHPFAITGAATETGGFAPAEPLPEHPVALGADEEGYLYVADAGPEPALFLVDIWQAEVARRVPLPGVPHDLAVFAGRATVVFSLADGTGGALTVGACDAPAPVPWPPALGAADRIAIARGPAGPRALLVLGAGTAAAEIVALDDTAVRHGVPFATDLLAGDADGERVQELVVARRPGEDFVRLALRGRRFDALDPLSAASFSRLAPLAATGYDGRGIARAPDGRVAYWTARGLRYAAPARPRYETAATVLCHALDSGAEANEWGRVLVEACVPDGTQVTVTAFGSDDLPGDAAAPRVPPAEEEPSAILLPEVTPLVAEAALARAGPPQALYRDETPPPGEPPPPDRFATYDAPVVAAPGRHLWLILNLAGNGVASPRIRALRVERHRHGLLRHLPNTLQRDPRARDFLGRYLAAPAAVLAEWQDASARRGRLFDPRTAPAEALEWLGSTVGLVMDPCWPERARRTMIAEAASLFRRRGTVGSLRRMLEILTGGTAIIVEKYRLRGGGVPGNPAAAQSRSVLGAGFRVGGAIGRDGETVVAGAPEAAPEDAAHRFSVILHARLSEEQRACVERLVETHKPAHTLAEVCTVDVGMRVGLGLHLGLASAIGRGSGFGRLVAGTSVLGRGDVLGRPALDRAPRPAGSWQPKEGA